MHHKYDFSLILACYNETEVFDQSVKEIIKVLDNTNLTYEIIFIDDKSQDNTAKLIRRVLGRYSKKNLSAYFHAQNQGRGQTVSEGFQKAKGRIVGFIDIDLEVPAWYMPRFVEALDKSTDGAIGWRVYDLDLRGLIRWIFSKGYVWLREQVLSLSIKDTEAGYKFFKREKILPVVKRCRDPHWFWDTEVVARALKAKLKLAEIPVVFIRRRDKTSTVNLIPDTLDHLKKLWQYQKELQLN